MLVATGLGPRGRLSELSNSDLQTLIQTCSEICQTATSLAAGLAALRPIQTLTAAQSAAVYLYVPPHQLSALAASGDPPALIPVDDSAPSLEAEVYRTGRSVVWGGGPDETPGLRPAAPGASSAIITPLQVQDQIWGVLAAYREHTGFTDRDLAVLETVGQAVAVVVALRASISQQESLWAGAPLGMASFDLEGRFINANDTQAKILGVPLTELIGRSMMDFVGTSDAVRVRQLFTDQTLDTNPHSHLLTAHRADGSPLVVEAWTAPLTVAGATVGVQVALRDLTAERHATERLEWLATHDPLTALGNRRWLEHGFATMLADDAQRRLTLIYIDVLNFSYINETYNHDIGDHLLAELGRRLTRVLSDRAICARVGSDDFAVLLGESADDPPFLQLLEGIKSCFEQPLTVDDQVVSLRPAIGVALYPRHAPDWHTLLRMAAVAASQVQATGPAVVFHAEGASGHQSAAAEIAQRLPRALAAGYLEPFYQPIVDLKTSKVVAAEALCRWHDPDLGLIYPSRFIPLAEESGLIVSIGRFMLQAACRQLKQWQTEFARPSRVQVNVSARQFEEPDFPELVAEIIRTAGLPPGSVALELTESVLVRIRESTVDPLQALARHQVPVIIDDFGIGFSSLSYLHQFKVDELKLDRSFLEPAQNGMSSRDLLTAIAEFAKRLGMLITVEGVEHFDQIAALRRLGFQRAQGYALAPPASAPACASWLEQGKINPAKPAKAAGIDA